MQRKIRIAPVVLCLTLAMGAIACGDDDSTTDTGGGDAGGSGSEESVKIGFITKFPVDFFDTMVDAVKAWNEDHPEVEVIFAQGESGTDDEGQINAIESMIEICRDHSANVKRWRDGEMALRWCAAGMAEAAKQFRKVNGFLHLPALKKALEDHGVEPEALVEE